MSDKAEVQQFEAPSAPLKRGFFGRLGAHYRRWWWLHLIIFVIVVLVITLPVVYVGYPRIAQGDVNAATLNITDLKISNPTPDTVQATQTQVLENKAIYHPTIYGFNATISLVGAAAPLSYAFVPKIQANDGEVIHVDTTLDLANSSAMTDFSKAVLSEEEVQLNFYGRPHLKEGALPKTTTTFNKTVTLKGLNGLKGFEITKLNLLSKENPDGTNTNGTVYIPNPSVLTVEMGNVTLDLSVNDTQIGQSFLNDFTLVPGNNTLPLTATINQTLVFSMLAKYSDDVLPVDIVGNKSVYKGVEIPYYSEALASNILHTKLNLSQALQ